VKDLFDWKGVRTGAGNPAWLDSHPVPSEDAGVLTSLLNHGAALVGKTVTDEMAYSIQGDNVHYGTPQNAAAPGRVPGGSSSGSAAAVAAGLADVGLGTDTGGSVRVPAAYCGLFGIRTTHGLVDRAGVVALAPSFDTVGWLARDPETLAAVGAVLLSQASGGVPLTKVWTLAEAEPQTDRETRDLVANLVRALGLPSAGLTGLTEPYGGLEGLRRHYVTIQGWEAWQTHGEWVHQRKPIFGPPIAQRFLTASLVTDEEAVHSREQVARFRADLQSALGKGGVLVLPASAGPAPLMTENEAKVDEVRVRTMRLTSPAGLSGLPQVTVPRRGTDGLPRGVGLVGPQGSDQALLALAIQAGGA
jgi:amidase